jgi:hypothetical protein
LQALRPNSTITNFKDFLNQSTMQISKSSQWRNM